MWKKEIGSEGQEIRQEQILMNMIDVFDDICKKHPFTPIRLSCIIEKLSDNTVNTKLELMNQYSRQARVQGGTCSEKPVLMFLVSTETASVCVDWHCFMMESVFRPAQVLSKPSHLAGSWPIRMEHKQTWRTMFSWPLCHRCMCVYVLLNLTFILNASA